MIGQAGASSAARGSALARAREERERDDGTRFSLDDAETSARRAPAAGEGTSAETQRPRRREDEELRAAPASSAHPQEARPKDGGPRDPGQGSDAAAPRGPELGRGGASSASARGAHGAASKAAQAADGAQVDAAASGGDDAFALEGLEGGAEAQAAGTDAQADASALTLPEGFDAAPAEVPRDAVADSEALGPASAAVEASAELDPEDPKAGALDEDKDDLEALDDLARDDHDAAPTLSGKDRLELSAHRADALRPAPRVAEGAPLSDRLAEAAHRTLAETHDTSNVLRFRAESHTFSALVHDGAREVRFTAESAATRAFIAERIAEVRGELHKVGQPASVSLATDTDGQRQQDARRGRDPEAQAPDGVELGAPRSPRPRVSAAPSVDAVAGLSVDPDHLNIVL